MISKCDGCEEWIKLNQQCKDHASTLVFCNEICLSEHMETCGQPLDMSQYSTPEQKLVAAIFGPA